MIKITLEPARNGVIKKIYDDNHGGANTNMTVTDVYEIGSDIPSSNQNLIRFLYEICEDLGLDVGNKFSSNAMSIGFEWGSHYEPTAKEIDKRIKHLTQEIELLKEIRDDKV